MGTILAIGILIWIWNAPLPETVHFKGGMIVGAAIVFCGHYLITMWLPVILDLLFRQ